MKNLKLYNIDKINRVSKLLFFTQLLLFCNVINITSSDKNLAAALELASTLNQKAEEQPKSSSVPEFIITVGDMMKLPVDCIVNAANSQIKGGSGVDGLITNNINPSTHKPYVCKDKKTQCSVGDVSGKILEELLILRDSKDAVPPIKDNLLPVGKAVITSSGSIVEQSAKTIRFVIATVGPNGSATPDNDKLLYDAYYNSLCVAANIDDSGFKLLSIIDKDLANGYHSNPIKTIAFPSISTGIFGYPVDQAAPMAISAIIKFLQKYPDKLKSVHLVVMSDKLIDKNNNKTMYASLMEEIKKQKYTKMLNDKNEPTEEPSNVRIVILDTH